MLQKLVPPSVVQPPQPILLIPRRLVLQERLKGFGHAVSQRLPVPLPLAVVRQPPRPGLLLLPVRVNLLFRPGVNGGRIFLKAGEILDFPDLLLGAAHGRPSQNLMETVWMKVQPGVVQRVRPAGVYLPKGRRQRREVGACAALGIHPALVGRAPLAGGAVLADLEQIPLRVLGEHRQHLRLTAGGAQHHGRVGVQAPVPPRLVHEGGDALPAQGLHEVRRRPERPPAHGLGQPGLLQPHPAEDVRLHPPDEGGGQAGVGGGVGLRQLAHQVHHKAVHDVRLLPGEGLGVEIAPLVLLRRLAPGGGLPGLRVVDVEIVLNHLGHILPALPLQPVQDGLHPGQCRLRVVVHQPQGAQAADFVDDAGFGFQVELDHPAQLPAGHDAVQGGHGSVLVYGRVAFLLVQFVVVHDFQLREKLVGVVIQFNDGCARMGGEIPHHLLLEPVFFRAEEERN